MHPLIFTTPIKPASYYLGRFLGSFFLTIFIQLGITLGLAIGFLMPYLDQDAIGIFRLDAYLHPIFIMVIPNVFLVGAILFSLAILSRRMLPTYLASVILLFGYLTSSNLTSDIETRWIASLLDPFGGEAISDLVKYWTPSERDTLLIPLGKWLVFNRVIWLFVGAFFFLFGMKKFSFSKEYNAIGVLDLNDLTQEGYLALLISWRNIKWNIINEIKNKVDKQKALSKYLKKSITGIVRDCIKKDADGVNLPVKGIWNNKEKEKNDRRLLVMLLHYSHSGLIQT